MKPPSLDKAKKPRRSSTPKPAVVPRLNPCPDCGVQLEAGKGKHKLAWHSCSAGPSTLDVLEQDTLRQIRGVLPEASIVELIALLGAIREHRRATTGNAVGDVADWITRS